MNHVRGVMLVVIDAENAVLCIYDYNFYISLYSPSMVSS
jgi:hypothetical protein